MTLTRRTFLKGGATLAALGVLAPVLPRLAEAKVVQLSYTMPRSGAFLKPEKIYTFSVYVRQPSAWITLGDSRRSAWDGTYQKAIEARSQDAGNAWRRLSITAKGEDMSRIGIHWEDDDRVAAEMHYPMIEEVSGSEPTPYIETARTNLLRTSEATYFS